jgi:hypothetical protein
MIDFQSPLTGVAGLPSLNQRSTAGMSSPGGEEAGEGELNLHGRQSVLNLSFLSKLCASMPLLATFTTFHVVSRGGKNSRQFLPRFTGRAIRVKAPAYYDLIRSIPDPPPSPRGYSIKLSWGDLRLFEPICSELHPIAPFFRKKKIVYFSGRREWKRDGELTPTTRACAKLTPKQAKSRPIQAYAR